MMKSRGFTLIELLVVIAIIGLLATMAVVSFSSAQRKARDSRRLADIAQMRKAIELYYDDNSNYPDACNPNTGCDAANLSAFLSPYMTSIPVDPTNSGTLVYIYARAPGAPESYAFRVRLEDGTDCKTGANVYPSWWGAGVPMCDF
jgi:type II secretion system protein G